MSFSEHEMKQICMCIYEGYKHIDNQHISSQLSMIKSILALYQCTGNQNVPKYINIRIVFFIFSGNANVKRWAVRALSFNELCVIVTMSTHSKTAIFD